MKKKNIFKHLYPDNIRYDGRGASYICTANWNCGVCEVHEEAELFFEPYVCEFGKIEAECYIDEMKEETPEKFI